MERKKSDKPKWRRKQYSPEEGVIGKIRLRREPRRMIKYGEFVYATVEELGNQIRQFELMDGGDKEREALRRAYKEPEPTIVQKDEYQVVARGKGGWFDVFSPDGKKMNEKALKAQEAEELKETLEAGQP